MTQPFDSDKLLKIKSIVVINSKGETVTIPYHKLHLKILGKGLCFTQEELFAPLCRGEKLMALFKNIRKGKQE